MTSTEIYIYTVVVLFGLLFGSFLNVCIYRIPRIHPGLTEESFMHLRGGSATIPPDILTKLESLKNQGYVTGNDFMTALEEQIGKEPAARYGELIFKYASFRRESVVFPSSHCPHCQAPIKPWDNVPVVSFLVLRGKCRACHAKISWRYPLVELLTAGVFLTVVHQFSLTLVALVYLSFVAALIAISFIDLDHQIIPDEITFPGIAVGIVASFFLPLPATVTHWYGSLLGTLVGGGVIALIGYVGAKVFKKAAMGGGDVKLMAMIGAFLGWQLALLTIFLGSVIGAVVGSVQKLVTGNEYIPFGPFLSLGAVMTLFFGQQFLFWYWNLIFPSF